MRGGLSPGGSIRWHECFDGQLATHSPLLRFSTDYDYMTVRCVASSRVTIPCYTWSSRYMSSQNTVLLDGCNSYGYHTTT